MAGQSAAVASLIRRPGGGVGRLSR
jgi:hypothetical protein